MDIEELDLDINIEVNSISDLREIRKELQKIAKAKREIDVAEDDQPGEDWDFPDIGDDYPDPNPGDPRFPKRDWPKWEKWFVKESDDGFDMSLETSQDELRLTSSEKFHRGGYL
jgi:hypothetical protein